PAACAPKASLRLARLIPPFIAPDADSCCHSAKSSKFKPRRPPSLGGHQRHKPMEIGGFRLKSSAMNSIDLIREFLKDHLGLDPETVTPEASLADIGVDSLMLLELMFEFEDRCGVTLSSNLKSPKTVGEMVSLMDQLRREKD
ncbi:MAG: acyl carrier protein, partial [Azonexus sp.]|nr:acyl carrier protein [Azonexus sp.]